MGTLDVQDSGEITVRKFLLASLAITSFGVVMATPAPITADDDRWETPRLKQCLEELGYEPTEINEKKWEIKLAKGNYNIPVATELSASGNYIWLTARLADSPSDEKAGRLLRRNAKIQPSQFYVSDKGSLLIGLTCDNRAMTNAVFRKALDKLTDDIVASAEDWGK